MLPTGARRCGSFASFDRRSPLLDLRMPVLDGIEAARRIRAEIPDTAIIMLTFFQDVDLFFESIRAGASGYLLKTVGRDELVRAIRAVAAGEAYLHPHVTRQMIELMRKDGRDPAPSSVDALLTEREREVLRGIALGQSNREIASTLYISPSTVQTHRAHLLAKLGLSSTAELVRFAVRIGLVDP
ncbi:MAG: DNA-binding response regulator [Dehalococcoidia bacterium]|nr:MAG: DNA-binding response regulator [Dehalococcoidia bacterium]